MIKRVNFLNCLFVTAFALCTGCGFVHEEELADNYYLVAIDSDQDMNVSYSLADRGKEYEGSFIGVIPKTVFAVGYNEEFIIAKQHPADFPKVDKSITNYFIIPLKERIDESEEKNVIGPMTKEEFEKKREELGVPKSLTFTKVFKELE